jgi:hypothetical protein
VLKSAHARLMANVANATTIPAMTMAACVDMKLHPLIVNTDN